MAIVLNGSSQYAYMSTSPVTATPLVFGCWVNLATTASAQCIMNIAGGSFMYFLIGHSSFLGKWYIAARNGGSEFYAASTATPSTGTWTHVLGYFDSSTWRGLYINGVQDGTNTTSAAPTLTKLGIGVRVDGAIPSGFPSYLNGSIAEVGVWDSGLTTDEIASLGKGVSPKHVRPQNLQVYVPFINSTTGAVNETGDAVTVAGSPSSATDHPRIYK